MEKLNLCEILKGHEGETFYNPLVNNLILEKVENDLLFFKSGNSFIDIPYHGKDLDDKLCVFPSKNQRDWNKWVKKQNSKKSVAKTWFELHVDKHSPIFAIELKPVHDGNYQNYRYVESIWSGSPIEKSILALLKIRQLIEVGYGGNITDDEWSNEYIDKYCISYNPDSHSFTIDYCAYDKNHIAFHTKEQAIKFMQYNENLQLIKEYFIINDEYKTNFKNY